MRLTKRRRESTSQIDMTPMIDIVFLLIIFFMTVSQISEVNNERLELAKQAGSEDQEPSVLTINVLADGTIVVAGNSLSLPQFISLVSDELQKVGDNPNRLTCTIRADQNSESKPVNEITSALKRLQIQRVNIAVEVPQ